MGRHRSNGHHPPHNGNDPNGNHNTEPQVDTANTDVGSGAQRGQGPQQTLDPIVESEAIRALLHEASGRLARLVGVLKQDRRQRRVFRQAVDSLRHLNLPS